ncbi:hypothetical protein FQR65_LT16727 [Abscondita terminalis]|nr:hypothetical protein FQR65_LT16727 [Abscondita terminalis]
MIADKGVKPKCDTIENLAGDANVLKNIIDISNQPGSSKDKTMLEQSRTTFSCLLTSAVTSENDHDRSFFDDSLDEDRCSGSEYNPESSASESEDSLSKSDNEPLYHITADSSFQEQTDDSEDLKWELKVRHISLPDPSVDVMRKVMREHFNKEKDNPLLFKSYDVITLDLATELDVCATQIAILQSKLEELILFPNTNVAEDPNFCSQNFGVVTGKILAITNTTPPNATSSDGARIVSTTTFESMRINNSINQAPLPMTSQKEETTTTSPTSTD